MPLVRPLSLFLLLLPSVASAQDVQVMINQDAKDILGSELQVAEDQIEELLRERFREVYRLVDVQDFLRVSANAQALSNKGLGVDYAAHPSIAIFGASIAASADAGDADLTKIAEPDTALRAGAGAQLALMGGLNLSLIGLPRVTVFANGLYHPWTVGELDGEFFNVGGHVQLALIKPTSLVAIEWMGIDVTSGVEISKMVLELENEQKSSAPIVVDDRSYEVRSTATGVLRLEQTAFNIPIEVTTGITLLQLFSLYGGVGVDFMFGGAKLEAALDATVEADHPTNAGEIIDVGTARVTAAEEGEPNAVFPRALVGAQLHIGPLNVFGQVNLGLTDVAVSVAGGLRISL